MRDPFATATPTDEIPKLESVLDAPPDAAPAPKRLQNPVALKPRLEASVDSGKVVVTFKGGTGFDAPWIVIHAADLKDSYDQVTGDNAVLLARLMEQVQAAGKYFSGTSPEKGRPTSSAPSKQRKPAPQEAQGAPNGMTRHCVHGEMNFKSGVSRKGNAYSGFFCPSEVRGSECKPHFLD